MAATHSAKNASTARGKPSARASSKPGSKWSQHVTETSDAMDLKDGVFKQSDPKKIARSLKSSAEHSDRRKAEPFRSAMSMLNFYINRAGDQLESAQRKHLDDAKDELRKLYGKPAARKGTRSGRREGPEKN